VNVGCSSESLEVKTTSWKIACHENVNLERYVNVLLWRKVEVFLFSAGKGFS
jgi:hypothetical protein